MIGSISHGHSGTQQMIVKDNNHSDAHTIPFDLSGCRTENKFSYIYHCKNLLMDGKY
jgi:hypothetical protein